MWTVPYTYIINPEYCRMVFRQSSTPFRGGVNDYVLSSPFFLGLEPGGYLEVMLQQVNGLFLSSPNAGYEPWNKDHETTVGSFHILGHPGGQCGRRLRCMVVDKHFSKYSTNERDVAWKRGEDRWSAGVQQLWNITRRWMWICSEQSRGGRF